MHLDVSGTSPLPCPYLFLCDSHLCFIDAILRVASCAVTLHQNVCTQHSHSASFSLSLSQYPLSLFHIRAHCLHSLDVCDVIGIEKETLYIIFTRILRLIFSISRNYVGIVQYIPWPLGIAHVHRIFIRISLPLSMRIKTVFFPVPNNSLGCCFSFVFHYSEKKKVNTMKM